MYDEQGRNIACTIIQAGPCVVTQVRTKEVDGYKAVQLGFDDKKASILQNLKMDTLRKQVLQVRKNSSNSKVLILN